MNLALAQRIGVSAPPTLPRKVANILKKFGSDAHLYLFGPGVPILGPELVTNGDGASVAGWVAANAVASIQSGEICNTGTGPLYPEVLQDFSTTVGKEYRVTGTSRRGTSANPAWVLAKRKLGGGNLTSSTANSSQVSAPFSFNFVAQDDQSRISLVQSSGTADAGTVLFDNISVREILGYSNTYSGFVAGNYFDSAGTTHASVDGSVGLVLDAAGSVGAELVNSAAWTLTQPTSGSVTNVAGTIAINSADGTYAAAKQGASEINATYRFSGTASGLSGGGIAVSIGAASYVPAAGPFSCVLVAPSSSPFEVKRANGVGAGTIVGLTVKQVTGIHATQTTPGYKPTLRKGIVNLLTWSNDLTNGAWVIANGASKSGQTLTLSNNFGSKVQQFSSAIALGGTCTAAFVLSGTPGVQVQIGVMDNGGAFPQSNTQVTLTATPTLYAITRPATTQAQVIPYIQDYGSATTVTVGACGLFQGTLTAAQILAAGGIPLTTTAPASSQAGVNYLEFKASNATKLNLGAQMFQMTDDQWVIAAFSVASTGVEQFIFAPAGSGGSADKACSILVNGGNAIARWTKGGVADYSITSPIIANTTYVVSARKIGNTGYLRVNGVAAGTRDLTGITLTTLTAGAIGCEVYGSSAPMTGSTYVVAGGKGAIPDADLLVLEKFVAQLSGVQL